MAGNLGQFMNSGMFIYVMLLAMVNEKSAQFRNVRKKFLPFHKLRGYGQNAGMTNWGKAEFFFLPYFIDLFEGFFQFSQGQTLGGVIGVIIQKTGEVIPVFPVGVGQSRFHALRIRLAGPFVEDLFARAWPGVMGTLLINNYFIS
jgi:hypothetical protein